MSYMRICPGGGGRRCSGSGNKCQTIIDMDKEQCSRCMYSFFASSNNHSNCYNDSCPTRAHSPTEALIWEENK